jgi:cell division protein FtsI (penicillin-binding protein 3)
MKGKQVGHALDKSRYGLVLVMMASGAVVLMCRLMFLQGLDGVEKGKEFLINQGEKRSVRTEQSVAPRGMILDRNGEPLAVSAEVYNIAVDPVTLFKTFDLNKESTTWSVEKNERWKQFAGHLELTSKELKEMLIDKQNKRFVYLMKQVSPEVGNRVLALKIPGVKKESFNRRFYPAGEVTSHVVGVTDIKDRGREGLELAYNTWLKGETGKKQIIRDLSGRVVRSVREIKTVEHGHDLITSVDLRLQFLTYKALKNAYETNKAQGASAIVLDAKTGEVLAMANQPAINPNSRVKWNPKKLRNKAVTDVFEPGSTVKPFTVLAALESGKFSADTVIDTSPGWIKVGGQTLSDGRDYGPLTLKRILQKSSQVGIIKLSLSLQGKEIRDAFSRVGLGKETKSAFPGERSGSLPEYKNWGELEKVILAYGYGLSVSAIQLAKAYTVFANKGKLLDVSFVKRNKPDTEKQVFKDRHIQDVLEMMTGVTQKGGTGVAAKVPGYSVAGKTGTSHKHKRKGGYAKHEYVSSFVGLIPSTNPEVIVAVIIDNPRAGVYYGGEVAAPVFSTIANGAMRILNVKPDDLDGSYGNVVVKR